MRRTRTARQPAPPEGTVIYSCSGVPTDKLRVVNEGEALVFRTGKYGPTVILTRLMVVDLKGKLEGWLGKHASQARSTVEGSL